MKAYELLYIIPSQFTDQEIETFQSHIGSLVEKTGGKVNKQQNLGKIKLAYSIDRVTHGSYVLVYFDAEPTTASALNRELTLADHVLRHTISIKPAGAEKRVFELTAYVPPLSDLVAPPLSPRSASTGIPAATHPAHPSVLPKKHVSAPVPPVAVPVAAEPSTMTMEELDKKLDEILQETDFPKDV